MASKKGTVALGEGMKLDNYFYMPKLNCNLVIVSKLCKQLNCAITYFDDFCVIQDRSPSRTLIRVGEQREGVYYYKRSSNQVNAAQS